ADNPVQLLPGGSAPTTRGRPIFCSLRSPRPAIRSSHHVPFLNPGAPMRITLTLIVTLALFTLIVGTNRAQPVPAQPKIRTLIVDGANNHDWPRATKVLKEIL